MRKSPTALENRGFVVQELLGPLMVLVLLGIGVFLLIKDDPDSGREFPAGEVWITTANLNLRECPGVSAECGVSRTLLEGEEVISDRRSGKWLHVIVPSDGATGWMHGDYARNLHLDLELTSSRGLEFSWTFWGGVAFLGLVVIGSVLMYIFEGGSVMWDQSPITVISMYAGIIGFAVLGVFALIDFEKKTAADDLLLERETLIEYFSRRERHFQDNPWWKGLGMPVDSAFTTGDVNLRSGPGRDNAVLRVVKRGSRVVLFGRTEEVPDWIKVNASGNIGWISARYLRPATNQEQVNRDFSRGAKGSLAALFPEKTLLWKIIGFLGGVLIAVLVSLATEYPEEISALRIGLTAAYYPIKWAFLRDFTRGELAIVFWGFIVFSFVLDRVIGYFVDEVL